MYRRSLALECNFDLLSNHPRSRLLVDGSMWSKCSAAGDVAYPQSTHPDSSLRASRTVTASATADRCEDCDTSAHLSIWLAHHAIECGHSRDASGSTVVAVGVVLAPLDWLHLEHSVCQSSGSVLVYPRTE